MAEESIDLSLSPELTKPGEGNIRRNSIGTPFYLSNEEKPVPHYLRASIGSCHDFCKYGRKHAFEAKARSPIRKINVTSRPPDAKSPVDKVIQAERKKATIAKPKPSPNSKASFAQNPKIIKLEVSSPSEKVEVSPKHALRNARATTDVAPTMKNVDASSKQAPSNARGIAHGVNHITPVKLKPMTVKPLPSPDLLKGSSGRRDSDINLGQKTGTSKVSVKKMLASSATRLSPKPSVNDASLYARKNGTPDVVSPLKNQNRIRKAEPQQPKNSKIPEKALRATLFSKPSINRVASLNARKYNNMKVVSPLKNLNRTRKAERQPLDDDKFIETSINQVASLNARKYKNMKVVSPLKNLNRTRKAERQPPDDDKVIETSINQVASLNARKYKNMKVVSPLKNLNRTRKAERQPPDDNKVIETSIYRVASLNARKYKNMKVVSPLKNLNRNRKAERQPPDDDKVIEKTLYVVKMNTNNKTLGSSPDESPTVKLSPSTLLLSSESSSEPTSPAWSSEEEEDAEESEYTISDADDFVPEDNETENINEAENSEGEHKRRPRKAGMVHSEAKDSSAVKLNFRRGKVLDPRSESKGPRRLRFRRGRLLGENQNGDNGAGRRSFKRRGVDDDTNGAKDESEKVVLRHQDVQGKKDAQGLLNNVIEETASKLVETRKSKVKALVGAFETVISLQETKPSTNTVT